MSHAYRRIEGRKEFLSLHAFFGGIEINSFLKAMGLEDSQLVKAGFIKHGAIDTATNCRYRPTAKGKRYFVHHAEYEAMLLLPGKGLALLRALDKLTGKA